ncbi:diadenosine tetraphosphate (Ap4A) hydrolase [Candidatus Pelagibacter sp. HTCC7211]|uniref:HIT family protein n=1 Tax=Pelagibacter sp. (strain HTCC7211) TaxID=439493 RepID=UPI0001839B04|nr:HIT family protein [Candidatus Pelagibacter sp. HTCC7211]EDZ59830.1 diadenosine tetraphosphate (Ap4A) hydrolase [Candidatus Pelagibacter sp. HTCC7211]MBD1151057.1 HIT family protein [Pelagibacterales bacterium SAG-MED25]
MENNNCIFCNKEKLNIIYEDDIFYVIRDAYPVTTDHTLIILNEHNKTYFDLRDKDIIQLNNIIKFQKDSLIGKDNSITGFNIGINQGETAGQTVMHLHIHLIPRRKGDIDDPRGGVRGVIPSKQKY